MSTDRIPFVGFSNQTLAGQPQAHVGQMVHCEICRNSHPLKGSDDGKTILLFYKCGKGSYLGAIGGRLVVGLKADVSGEI